MTEEEKTPGVSGTDPARESGAEGQRPEDASADLERKADLNQGGNTAREEDLKEKAYGDDEDTPDVPLPG